MVRDCKFEGQCFNCKKKGHMARDCKLKSRVVESNLLHSRSRMSGMLKHFLKKRTWLLQL